MDNLRQLVGRARTTLEGIGRAGQPAFALCLLIPAILLASCGTTGPSAPDLPITPEPCPAAATATLEAEPLPPEGVDEDALTAAIAGALGERAEAFLAWFEAEWPAWARRTALRLEQTQNWCVSRQTTQLQSPPR